ncbi:MAG: SCP2 sterol-binding domain-containing protein [Lachnospiraceae bacterium]|nr:SCP2 sterol-binding domain-containing protein [Lachnospiraceae bacterium]
MKINIYYGGRGIIGDPSLLAVKKMEMVLDDLQVEHTRYDLFDIKNNITTLPSTLKDADGIILATTVEWYGIGGYLMSFLDACWLYGDKEKMKQLYMAPVVMSTTYGEREALLDLKIAWETLGGSSAEGICGYFPDSSLLEKNQTYGKYVEKAAEDLYRCISQRRQGLPVSNKHTDEKVNKTKPSILTQKETEQYTELITNEKFVEQQKVDVKELTGQFMSALKGQKELGLEVYTEAFEKHFKAKPEVHTKYKFVLKGRKENLLIQIDNSSLITGVGEADNPDVVLTMDAEVLDEIIGGRATFQGSFMAGKIVNKGDFGRLRQLDIVFPFMEDHE